MSSRSDLRGWPVRLGIFWVLAGPILAQTPNTAPEAATPKPTPGGTIVIGATAHKRVPNTVADVVVGIQADGRDVATVSKLLEQHSQALLEFLRQQGAERLRTEDVSVEPQTETQPNSRDHIVGYNGHLSISFRSTPQQLPALLGGSLEHGANTIIQTVLMPNESEIDAARQELAVNATKTALAQAEAVAKAADSRVVGIREINVEPEGEVVPFRSAQAEKGASISAAITRTIATAAGEQELAVRVVVHATIDH
jgi:uncharacterized protein YggE